MEVLKCKTVSSVLQELHAFAIVYNLVRLVMRETAVKHTVSVHRVSFIDSMHWLIYSIKNTNPVDIIINPLRPKRFEPRAIKRRSKQYDLLNKPRIHYKVAAYGLS